MMRARWPSSPRGMGWSWSASPMPSPMPDDRAGWRRAWPPAGWGAWAGWAATGRPRDRSAGPRPDRSLGDRGRSAVRRGRARGLGPGAGRAAPRARARPRRAAGRAGGQDRPLRARHRLPPRAARAARGPRRRPAGLGAAGRRGRVRRRSAAGRAGAGGACRAGLDRQEHEPADPRACRLVGLHRRHPQLGGAARRRAGAHELRELHAVPDRLPDRRAGRRPRRSTRAAASATSRSSIPACWTRGRRAHRRLDLRVRRVPGGLPGQRRRRRHGAAAGPAAAPHRVAAADGRPRVRPRGGDDGADPCRDVIGCCAMRSRRWQCGAGPAETTELLRPAPATRGTRCGQQAARALAAPTVGVR